MYIYIVSSTPTPEELKSFHSRANLCLKDLPLQWEGGVEKHIASCMQVAMASSQPGQS